MTAAQKNAALQQIANEITATGGGPLRAPGINPVPGEGNPDAEIMFIGEAPGFNENSSGRPFVGQAGKLLRKTLLENGWQEQEVYITNIVKYRPPENRDPKPLEIEFFRPFLDKQIAIIDPKILVTLGRFSLYKFLGSGVPISRIHGQPQPITWHKKTIIIFPMFHPAAALRDDFVMNMFSQDFRQLRELIDQKEPPQEETKTPSPQIEAKQLELI